jgi:hypothetical protein
LVVLLVLSTGLEEGSSPTRKVADDDKEEEVASVM